VARRILVVEDSPTQAERVRLLLEREGYRVEVAANGREGLQRAQSTPPDLIISDVVMPEMDGFTLCRLVKSTEATRGIPFVLLTERHAPPDVIQGFEVGADNFIPKPFADAVLSERVRRIFEHLDRQMSGAPEPEVTLDVGDRRFVVSAGKAQIVELLLSTLEDLARANALLQIRERDLELKTQDLEAFAYTVSHDLKAPLRGMGGFAQMIQEDYADRLDEKGRHYLDRIRESAQRMGVLIDDLLQYSRVERRTMRWEPVDLERLVQDLIADRQAEIEARGVRVEVALPFREIVGEREGLRHALANLLDNALKFGRKVAHPTITIRGEVRATERVLSVADNGIGFNPMDGEKAFAIFQRLHSQEEYEGTGIGLAIVRRVVERHGGRAWAESEPGKGATFYLAIPTRNGGLAA